ncbi:MAG: ABC transporter ATP-binding protein [Candidatus Nitrosopolaris sp.]|jgi:putative ABC transport system ATP-binding protein
MIVSNNEHSNYSDSKEITLKVENLSKVYVSAMGRVVSLRNVSFSVSRGEFVSVVGPSGSGKSTLLNMIGALDRPTSGKVFLDGIDIFSLNDSQIATVRNNTLGFIFQSYNLINRTTILKNVEFPGITGGMSDGDRRRRALKLLGFLGIKDKAKYKPTNLSGGQQQRVAIARALMNDPKIVLADEPTGNLDTKTGADVFNLLTMLSREFKRTIIMVTHNPELAAATDRAIHIRDGSIEKEVVNVERQM